MSATSAAPSASTTEAPSLVDLYLGFMNIAALAFGGVLPWARYVIVERRRWLSAEEFTDTLALCQLLPGPNIVNMSVTIGARFRGPAGSVAAFLGLMVLPVVVVLVLATVYAHFAEVPAVAGALRGMAAAAAGLVVAMAVKMAEPMLRRRFWATAPVILVTFLALAIMRWPLWPVILVVAPAAILIGWRQR